MSKVAMPTYDSMMNPVIQALRELGGSGTIEEINDKVAEIAGFTDEQLEVLHNPEKGGMTEIDSRLAWTRTYLKRYGVLENSSRGVWALTQAGRKVEAVDEKEVIRVVRELMREAKASAEEELSGAEAAESWREDLLSTLNQMEASAFERLAQRMLRESGFVQVEVTGRSGDRGIDGKGIMRLGGLLSFHVIFQCKRWQGTVGAGEVRDFRGAMVGRADKGLLITTGTFSKEVVGGIASALAGQEAQGTLETMLWITDLATISPACIASGALLLRRKPLGYTGGTGPLLPYSMLFFGQVPVMVSPAIYGGSPVDLVGLGMMAGLGIASLVFLVLFLRGIARRDAGDRA